MRYATVILMAAVSGLAGKLSAADQYVRADAAGAGDGSDWNNAYTMLPADLTRGDTYYVADGDYAVEVSHPEWGECVHTFKDAESGTLYITIKKAVAADHGTDTGWQDDFGDGTALFSSPNASAIFAFTRSYYIINGRTGGGPGAWQDRFGIKLLHTGTLVTLHGPSDWQEDHPHHIEFRHVEFEGGLASLEYDSAGVATTQPSDIMWAIGPHAGYEGPEHIGIRHCFMHDAERMMINGTRLNHWTIEYTYFARNHSDSYYHAEAVQAQGGRHWIFRYNVMEDIEGTAYLAIKKNSNNHHDDWRIHGNIFFNSQGSDASIGGNGVIGISAGGTTDTTITGNFRIYNNTFYNLSGYNCGIYLCERGEGTPVNNRVYNNLWIGCDKLAHTGITYDYNDYYDTPLNVAAGTYDRELTGDPLSAPYDGDFRLRTAGEPGLTLTDTFAYDMDGVARGADGTWDRGAIEFVRSAVSDFENRSTHPPSPGTIPNPILGSTEHMRMISILGGSAGPCGIALVKTENRYVKRVVTGR